MADTGHSDFSRRSNDRDDGVELRSRCLPDTPALGKRIIKVPAHGLFFSQGHPADHVFYLHSGRARLTVVSGAGKEAAITLLVLGEFIGEASAAAVAGRHMATASAATTCTAPNIHRGEMLRVMHEEHAFSDMFLSFLISRSLRIQADLIDQLFNPTERRLAPTLLFMAEFGQPGEPEKLLPKISQQTLEEMIDTTRSRVSFLMNRFRKLGFIEYNGRIHVNESLLNVVLHDQPSERDTVNAPLFDQQVNGWSEMTCSSERDPAEELAVMPDRYKS